MRRTGRSAVNVGQANQERAGRHAIGESINLVAKNGRRRVFEMSEIGAIAADRKAAKIDRKTGVKNRVIGGRIGLAGKRRANVLAVGLGQKCPTGHYLHLSRGCATMMDPGSTADINQRAIRVVKRIRKDYGRPR